LNRELAMSDVVASMPMADKARGLAPVVWLLGKVQSGKTSIVRELTHAGDAEIGSGFRACTRTARVFDFPSESPIIRFLDTRGLGEAAYDPQEDIGFCEGRSHLILAVVKALDFEQQAVLDVIRVIKKRHPEWPVVVAQTHLHEGYAPGERHVLPYPFGTTPAPGVRADGPLPRALEHQRTLFRGLQGGNALTFVPIDFTQADDGFDPIGYGREALIEALIAAAPAAVAAALSELPPAHGDSEACKSNAHIFGFALAAGASDALPLAGVIAVPAVQAAMLRRLAELHGAQWDKRAYVEFAGALGTATLMRAASAFGVRQLVKLMPIYGQTAGAAAAAAASFAATYAIGKAASYFLAMRKQGRSSEAIASVYQAALKEAFRLAKERDVGAGAAGAGS
jgi:uncharacterized protein (DUF697 family)